MSAQRPKRPGSPVDRPAGGVYQLRSRGLRSGRSPGAPSVRAILCIPLFSQPRGFGTRSIQVTTLTRHQAWPPVRSLSL